MVEAAWATSPSTSEKGQMSLHLPLQSVTGSDHYQDCNCSTFAAISLGQFSGKLHHFAICSECVASVVYVGVDPALNVGIYRFVLVFARVFPLRSAC